MHQPSYYLNSIQFNSIQIIWWLVHAKGYHGSSDTCDCVYLAPCVLLVLHVRMLSRQEAPFHLLYVLFVENCIFQSKVWCNCQNGWDFHRTKEEEGRRRCVSNEQHGSMCLSVCLSACQSLCSPCVCHLSFLLPTISPLLLCFYWYLSQTEAYWKAFCSWRWAWCSSNARRAHAGGLC